MQDAPLVMRRAFTLGGAEGGAVNRSSLGFARAYVCFTEPLRVRGC